MAAVRAKDLRSSSLTMKLLFGERRMREERGDPSPLYPQPQLK